ncbi:DinB family protein [Nocardioides mesophilus]|uniref:DinB family protein n=1 Tax=Nocardioides mesophilus TaxID=433659 RepID=A0A7G9R7W8_9ACTN|nr:DinB family protein [Nocardioides mesophilus]QNN51693.1 DinB family protein [Nocardioides mesophilus]
MEIFVAGERALLEGLLDVQREEVGRLLSGLDDASARARLVPSLTTPLGLVKHATFVEKVWLHSRVARVPRDELGLPGTVDESFVLEPEDTVGSVSAAYRAACERSREVAAAHDLDEQFPWHRGPVSLRFIYGHMIAELARHAGHGDILVEQLSTATDPQDRAAT